MPVHIPKRTAKSVEATMLPAGMLVLDVADRARSAALSFFRGTNLGWQKSDLMHWLVREYGAVTRVEGSRGRSQTPNMNSASEDSQSVERMLLETRKELLDVVFVCTGTRIGTPFFVFEALVSAATDSMGGYGFIPTDVPDMSLLDRVAGLVVADFLTRPTDYRDHLVVCDECGEISFDWEETHLETCTGENAREFYEAESGTRELAVVRSAILPAGLGASVG